MWQVTPSNLAPGLTTMHRKKQNIPNGVYPQPSLVDESVGTYLICTPKRWLCLLLWAYYNHCKEIKRQIKSPEILSIKLVQLNGIQLFSFFNLTALIVDPWVSSLSLAGYRVTRNAIPLQHSPDSSSKRENPIWGRPKKNWCSECSGIRRASSNPNWQWWWVVASSLLHVYCGLLKKSLLCKKMLRKPWGKKKKKRPYLTLNSKLWTSNIPVSITELFYLSATKCPKLHWILL